MQFDPIEEDIKKILGEVADEGKEEAWSTTEWTKRIKIRFCELGKKHRFHVYASGCNNAAGGEWLYDVTWLKYDKDDYLRTVPLVMECEWSLNKVEIDHDFQKLLLARSQHRVMIFYQKTEDTVLEKIKNFKKQIKKYRGTCSGDRYFFAGYSDNTYKFYYSFFSPVGGSFQDRS